MDGGGGMRGAENGGWGWITSNTRVGWDPMRGSTFCCRDHFLLVKFGWGGLLWRDAAFLVLGKIASSVGVGNKTWEISRRLEHGMKAQSSDMTILEASMGNDRT